MRPQVTEIERRDRQPCRAVEGLDRERRGYDRSKDVRIDGPVSEEEIRPALGHQPGPRRERPRSVGDIGSRIFCPAEYRHSSGAKAAWMPSGQLLEIVVRNLAK